MRRLGWGAIGASGALTGVLALTGASLLAGAAAARPGAPWIVTPADAVCRSEIDLTGRSGAAVEVWLESDGDHVTLRFARDEIPTAAFLPIRIDQRPYGNLVQRTPDARAASMVLSDATQAALRKGAVLQIAWLADEVLSGSLAGSEQGLADLRTCGAQVAAQHRARLSAQAAEQARTEADARAKAVADEQLAAARAQTAAAQAEQHRVAAESRKAAAEADRLAAETERQRAVLAEQQRQAQAARYDDYDQAPPQTWQPAYPQPAYRRSYGYADPRYDYDDN